ncbi:splicing coactivator SRRM1 [Schizosaccharomyces cryophilus OY26]|uniref:Splicing coactivator SRRM1 n=1 Tax=Schizosaccharomyces cryophilus (strain OY26 / ATCC MYA-4695 / CBS 11777 / NBRC 106824 / NRRL Y48691) TaxID=653667 RepID=S9WYC3_SCHCR|nr:splicing coactivator SRRM1 [Schizosaccharomyces cryophilus OY26]EPY49732.1 splicing coactivator SRRM1 [Schizosaccharomyces cryophilus OY26]
MRDTKFPPSFEAKVDMKKVNIEVLKPWIANRLIELIGFEDEVVIDFVYSMLEEAVEASKSTDSHNEVALDPKKVQLNLTGFLESKASEFTEELWMLILSASQNPYGIPEKFIQEKKEELSKLRLKSILPEKVDIVMLGKGQEPGRDENLENLREENRKDHLMREKGHHVDIVTAGMRMIPMSARIQIVTVHGATVLLIVQGLVIEGMKISMNLEDQYLLKDEILVTIPGDREAVHLMTVKKKGFLEDRFQN